MCAIRDYGFDIIRGYNTHLNGLASSIATRTLDSERIWTERSGSTSKPRETAPSYIAPKSNDNRPEI